MIYLLFFFFSDGKRNKKRSKRKRKAKWKEVFPFRFFMWQKHGLILFVSVKPTDIYLYPPAAPLMKLFLAEKQGTLSKP